MVSFLPTAGFRKGRRLAIGERQSKVRNPPALERGLPCLVAFDQYPSAGQANSLPRQCGDVAVAEGGG